MCKRGLTRDACLREAITRRAAGAGHERGPGTTLPLPLVLPGPPTPPWVPCPRCCAPHLLHSCTEVPLRQRRAASTTQPASQRLEPRSPYPSSATLGPSSSPTNLLLSLLPFRFTERGPGKKIVPLCARRSNPKNSLLFPSLLPFCPSASLPQPPLRLPCPRGLLFGLDAHRYGAL